MSKQKYVMTAADKLELLMYLMETGSINETDARRLLGYGEFDQYIIYTEAELKKLRNTNLYKLRNKGKT